MYKVKTLTQPIAYVVMSPTGDIQSAWNNPKTAQDVAKQLNKHRQKNLKSAISKAKDLKRRSHKSST